MIAGLPEDVAHHVAKAEARLPVLSILPVFVPPASRPVALAWIALLGELREALFERSDPRVTGLKCAWWAEELQGMGRGAARHPLGRLLASTRVPWAEAADPLLALAVDDTPPADTAAASTALRPLATPLAAIDATLLGRPSIDPALVEALVRHWQSQRLWVGRADADGARIPMTFWARHGRRRTDAAEATEVHRDWATHLRGDRPGPMSPASLLRRVLDHSDHVVLSALSVGAEPRFPRWRGPFDAWRCARDAALHYRLPPPLRT